MWDLVESGDYDADTMTLSTKLRGCGGIPRLLISDARLETSHTTAAVDSDGFATTSDAGATQAQVWTQLSLDAINAELAAPLTRIEHALSTKTNVAVYSAGDLVPKLRNFDVDVGAAPLDCAAEVVLLRLTNTTPLAAKVGSECSCDVLLCCSLGSECSCDVLLYCFLARNIPLTLYLYATPCIQIHSLIYTVAHPVAARARRGA
jgi:hypothetical protein